MTTNRNDPQVPTPAQPASVFERIRHVDEDGEWWSARELGSVLGYAQYRNIAAVVEAARAMAAQQEAGSLAVFAASSKNPGKAGGRPREDVRLNRFAAYFFALSADSRKSAVAVAKVYFAVLTRERELQIEAAREAAQLPAGMSAEDRARWEGQARERMAKREEYEQHDIRLRLVARLHGVISSQEFARFVNAGYRGLYHESAAQLAARKRISGKERPMNWSGSTELAINSLRASIATDELEAQDTKTAEDSNAVHQDVGEWLRAALAQRGMRPEALPTPAMSIKQLIAAVEALEDVKYEEAHGLWSLLPQAEHADEGTNEA